MNNEVNELKHKAITGSIWKFMERVLAQGISLIVSILLARLLTPDEYGTVSIVTIFFTFANVVITSGLNTALIQKKDADEEDYTAVLVFSVLFSFIFYFIFYISAPYISRLYNNYSLTLIIRIMGISLPIMAVKSVLCAYISSNLKFKKFFFSTIIGTIVSAIVGFFLAINKAGVWALVAQQLVNTIIDTLILTKSVKLPLTKKINFAKFKILYKYSWKIFVSSFMDTLYNYITPMLVGIKYSSADLSFYNKGNSFPNTLTASVNSTLAAVLFPVMSKFQEDKNKMLQYTRLFIRLSSYIIFPMMLGFIAVSDNFVRILLTEKWLPCSYYIKVFSISSMFIMIATGNCETIKAMGRSDIFLKMEILKKSLYFVVIFLFIIFSKSPRILALSTIVCTLISIVVNTYPNVKLLDYTYRNQIEDLLPNLIASLTMSAIVYVMNYINISIIALFINQIIVGVVIYIVISVLTKNKSYTYILNTIRLGRSKN